MSNILDPTTATGAKVTTGHSAARVATFPNGLAYFVKGITGTIAAATNGEVFAMRLNPGAGATVAYIKFVKISFRTIVAFTTPATFRALRLRRFTGTAPSGGTTISVAGQCDPSSAVSQFNSGTGGIVAIGTTTNLTAPGTPDAVDVERVNLTNFGAAGATTDIIWLFKEEAGGRAPLILRAGHSIAIGTTAIFDAAGTWEADITVGWSEGEAP